LDLRKAFEIGEIGSCWLSKTASWLWLAFKSASWHWPAFKIGELALASFQNRRVGSGQLSKSASWLWPAFKIGELALASFQNQRVGSGQLSKALGAALRILLSNRSKGFELAGFKKLFAILKAFHAK
jgi:hypothetical protein